MKYLIFCGIVMWNKYVIQYNSYMPAAIPRKSIQNKTHNAGLTAEARRIAGMERNRSKSSCEFELLER